MHEQQSYGFSFMLLAHKWSITSLGYPRCLATLLCSSQNCFSWWERGYFRLSSKVLLAWGLYLDEWNLLLLIWTIISSKSLSWHSIQWFGWRFYSHNLLCIYYRVSPPWRNMKLKSRAHWCDLWFKPSHTTGFTLCFSLCNLWLLPWMASLSQ